MALNPPVLVLPLLQLLHAASFGATHLGMLGYVAAKAPPGQAATAQGYLAIALGTIMAGATALSGVLYGAFGSLAYAAMASAAIAGGAAAGIAVRASRNVAAV
jgi:PPP family 3-phenylpropionic acid transporter